MPIPTDSLPYVELHFDCGIACQAAYDLLKKNSIDVTKDKKRLVVQILPLSENSIVGILLSIGVKSTPTAE